MDAILNKGASANSIRQVIQADFTLQWNYNEYKQVQTKFFVPCDVNLGNCAITVDSRSSTSDIYTGKINSINYQPVYGGIEFEIIMNGTANGSYTIPVFINIVEFDSVKSLQRITKTTTQASSNQTVPISPVNPQKSFIMIGRSVHYATGRDGEFIRFVGGIVKVSADGNSVIFGDAATMSANAIYTINVIELW